MCIFKSRCYNGGNRHNFQPRFDEVDRQRVTQLQNVPSAEDLRRIITLNVYVRDVCVWCGETIERQR
jgi:hypothetical protein